VRLARRSAFCPKSASVARAEWPDTSYGSLECRERARCCRPSRRAFSPRHSCASALRAGPMDALRSNSQRTGSLPTRSRACATELRHRAARHRGPRTWQSQNQLAHHILDRRCRSMLSDRTVLRVTAYNMLSDLALGEDPSSRHRRRAARVAARSYVCGGVVRRVPCTRRLVKRPGRYRSLLSS
jgi:hypothetical protein